jgi:hypothetical protein
MSTLPILYSKKLWGMLSIALMGLVFIISLISNLGLESSYGLWIDEEITFFPIQKIIKPYDLKEFWWFISDGGDYRYGRSLWNLMSAISYFPTLIWGPLGQIIAGRQLQVILLLISFWLLSHTFIQNGFLRFLLLLALCSAPYSSYYMSMPKPEPELLFFGSLFLFFYFKNKGAYGGAFWILLGLSVGSKISFLPPALVFFGVSLYLELQKNAFKQVCLRSAYSVLYTALGFCLAIPAFFQPFILFSYPVLVLIFVFNVFSKKIAIFCAFLLIGFIGALFKTELIHPSVNAQLLSALHPIKFWYLSTLGSVNEGGPGPNYNIINWLAFIPREWLKTPFTFGFFYMSALGYCAIMCGYRIYQLILNKETRSGALLHGVLFIIGILMLASPMTAVKNRLWGMYLYPGFVLFITYLFAALDKYLHHSQNKPILLIQNNITEIGKAILGIFLLTYAIVIAPVQLFSNLSILGYMPSLREIYKSDEFNDLWNKNIYPMALIITILYTILISCFFWVPAWISDFYYMMHNTEKFHARPWLIGM